MDLVASLNSMAMGVAMYAERPFFLLKFISWGVGNSSFLVAIISSSHECHTINSVASPRNLLRADCSLSFFLRNEEEDFVIFEEYDQASIIGFWFEHKNHLVQ